MTGTPFLSVISLGLYSNLFAVMCTTCSAPAGTAAVAKRCQPAAIPTAAKTTRAVTVIIRFIAQLFRSQEHTSELQSRLHLVCRLLLEKKKNRVLSMAVLY